MSESEFEFIARHLRPLAAQSPGALGLEDDAALVDVPPGEQLVIAKDALVEGVHFLAHDPAELIAKKALRVNLSDMAAMGALPLGYLLAFIRPRHLPPEWLSRFTQGLAADQETFNLQLFGGDTSATPGPLCLAVTMLGQVPPGQALRRRDAKVGDDIYVSGTLGDAALGLKVLQGRLSPPMSASDYLVERYRLPLPRISLGIALRTIAHAAIDLSDGLLADLGHILKASGAGAELWSERIPMSQAAARQRGALTAALSGGDDYEIMFTCAPKLRGKVAALAKRLDLPLTPIGRIIEHQEFRLLDADGRPMQVTATGWQHF